MSYADDVAARLSRAEFIDVATLVLNSVRYMSVNPIEPVRVRINQVLAENNWDVPSFKTCVEEHMDSVGYIGEIFYGNIYHYALE